MCFNFLLCRCLYLYFNRKQFFRFADCFLVKLLVNSFDISSKKTTEHRGNMFTNVPWLLCLALPCHTFYSTTFRWKEVEEMKSVNMMLLWDGRNWNANAFQYLFMSPVIFSHFLSFYFIYILYIFFLQKETVWKVKQTRFENL